MRQSGPPGEGANSPSNGMRNIQQQDMMAFKKILEQISNDGGPSQPLENISTPSLQAQHSAIGLIQMLNKNNQNIITAHQQQQQQHQQHQQQQQVHGPLPHQPDHLQIDEFKAMNASHQQPPIGMAHLPPDHQQIEEFKKMFPFGPHVPRQLPNNHRSEDMKALLIEQQNQPGIVPLHIAAQQNRLEILKRPEAQALIQRTFTFLCKYINFTFVLILVHNQCFRFEFW